MINRVATARGVAVAIMGLGIAVVLSIALTVYGLVSAGKVEKRVTRIERGPSSRELQRRIEETVRRDRVQARRARRAPVKRRAARQRPPQARLTPSRPHRRVSSRKPAPRRQRARKAPERGSEPPQGGSGSGGGSPPPPSRPPVEVTVPTVPFGVCTPFIGVNCK